MNINWEAIKEELIRDIDNVFIINNPSFTNLEEGLELFRKVIFSNNGGFELGGLKRELPNALQDAFIDKIGQLEPLRVIATCLDAYLKKICIISHKETSTSVHGKTLRPLLERLEIIQSTCPSLREPLSPSSFRGQPNYLEFVCDAYQIRNKVHESPNLKRVEVISHLTNIMVVYLYAAFKYKNEINAIPNSQPNILKDITEKISKEEKYLYYFISYGNTTHKIKNEIIVSYILNYLQENNQLTIEEIKNKCNIVFNSKDLQSKFYFDLLTKLSQEKKVIIEKQTHIVTLSLEEKSRISKIVSDFDVNKNLFFSYLQDIGNKYSITNLGELYNNLQEFIENNYNIDVAEAYNKGVDITNDENKIYQKFINYIFTITSDKNAANLLFRDLIELSKDSDFLLRICASRVFASLTNPDRFQQYANQQERVVYLDTQIILFALCLNYVHKAEYKNYQYETTEELISIAQKNKSIKLKVSRLYVQEVAYQLKMALLLIPFETVAGKKISTNVFYQFYWHLKDNSLLDEEDETFADFMKNWFNLEEEDAYENSFWNIAYNNIIEYLESDDLNIEVETIPTYENKNNASDIIRGVLNLSYKDRPKNVIDNDAVMICHLCNNSFHTNEPFFLTWDKEFGGFRKKYMEKFKRADVLGFHLFNPAKFINHCSLLKFKINPQAMTDGFLSIMDTFNIRENTTTIWDTVNKYLNIDNLKSTQRKKHIQTVKNILETDFEYTIDDVTNIQKTNNILQPLDIVINKINDYYVQGEKYNMQDFKLIMLSDEYFEKTTSIIFKSLNKNTSDEVIAQINELILKYKNT